jgi:hypothetical protein
MRPMSHNILEIFISFVIYFYEEKFSHFFLFFTHTSVTFREPEDDNIPESYFFVPHIPQSVKLDFSFISLLLAPKLSKLVCLIFMYVIFEGAVAA